MGLDMYIYRVSKPNMSNSMTYNVSDIDGIILNKNDIHLDPKTKQLIPYTQLVKVKDKHYNSEKIKKDFGLSNYFFSEWSPSDVTITDARSGKSVEIPTEILESKYTVERVENKFVCNYEEVKYWRKAYDIQNWFHENIEVCVENTGFYILSVELISKFNKQFTNDYIQIEEPDERSALFYWEWY